ncbi:hypothetical protein PAXRUDRAFT_21419 [Paxillus rubicundulus Ve08.2h10]|uniref:Uncharacterized protein n=1 Tax=Paxillus rubicundulus Ve08.2h10 TaxID=930991 RepID=A0A0D0D7N0_9AGAM|nr:hypothetical protein PAXRUDRAFT_21419 [Paxillus rubicundulus Ve08.2h10]
MGIPMGACMPCHQGKVSCNLSRCRKALSPTAATANPRKLLPPTSFTSDRALRSESVAPNPAPEPPKAPSPGPSQGPTRRSSHATLKVLVTPSKWAPSLGPGLSTSKKAKASVSKYRPKIPSVTQKAKFSIDASALELIATPVNPLLDPHIKGLEVNSLAQVVKALQEQVQGQLAAHSFPTSSHRSLPLPASVSRQMQRLHLEMANSHPQSAFLALEAEGQPSSHLGLQLVSPSDDGGKSAPSPLRLHMHQQPHLGVEMEDDASGDTSNGNARPPLPIPPPLTDLVPPIESFSSEADMELGDVDRAHAVLWTVGYGQPRLTKTRTTWASQLLADLWPVVVGYGWAEV